MKCNNCGNEHMLIRRKTRIPTWAIVVAILLFIFTFGLSLLFLLVKKEEEYFFCPDCGNKINIDA